MGAHAVTLRDWIAAHGPLSAPTGLLLALDICAQLGRVSPRRIGETLASLDTANIMRTDGGWVWHPAAEDRAPSADSAAIERLGVLLFEWLAGDRLRYPLPDERPLREQLRALRPDLATAVVDIVVAAASRPASTSLAQLALDLRQAIANERTRDSRRRSAVFLAVCVVAVMSISWAAVLRRENRLELHGLTQPETVAIDVMSEMAQAYALIDEHTAAAGLYDGMATIWRRRIPVDDPRDAWNEMHLAWVKSLASDRVTAEQLLLAKPVWLTNTLGVQHPYARAAALELAHAVFARSTPESAAALREQAERNTASLLAGTIDPADLLTGIPVPPGTVAHAAPTAPVLEGFRARTDGSFAIPLTSIQRWIAGRDGWRLHAIAAGACRASVVVGGIPRLITLSTSRTPDNRWQIHVDGTKPPLTLYSESADKVGVSLMASGGDTVRVRIGGQSAQSTVIDAGAPPPEPPYSLWFDGNRGGPGCALVWLETPFPYEPKS